MRRGLSALVVSALAACTGRTIDAGSNDSGSGAPMLAGGASDAGPTIIASLIQLTPMEMVSDGTTLFWISDLGGISSVPVNGGPIASVVPGSVGLLAVDDVHLYYLANGGIYSASKDGSRAAALVAAPDGGSLYVGTVFGNNVYWIEESSGPGVNGMAQTVNAAKTTILQTGSTSSLGQFVLTGLGPMGVTETKVFFWGEGGMYSFSLPAGFPAGGGLVPLTGIDTMDPCTNMLSDIDAVFCQRQSSSIMRVANDGTATVLGTFLPTYFAGTFDQNFAVDDRYVYWLDNVSVGRVVRVPKTGGTAVVIATDTSPVAIAVDANAVYWSDLGGNIMRLAK